MNRYKFRENLFKLLFLSEFHSQEDMEQQKELFFDSEEFENVITTDKDKILDKYEHIIPLKEKIDDRINEVASGWSTERMGRVELTILRLAVYEMIYDEDVPVSVAINEAVELAKKYGQDESPSFINGILAKLA